MFENGWRKGMKEEVSKTILKHYSPEELDRIDEQRSYLEIKENTITKKLMLQVDSIRRNRDKFMSDIEQMLISIKNSLIKVNRVNEQLKTGKITDELKPGLLMNKEELEIEKDIANRMALGISKDIPVKLAELRKYVGASDIDKNIIITEKQFDDYVVEIEQRLKEVGFDLFEQDVS